MTFDSSGVVSGLRIRPWYKYVRKMSKTWGESSARMIWLSSCGASFFHASLQAAVKKWELFCSRPLWIVNCMASLPTLIWIISLSSKVRSDMVAVWGVFV